MPFFVFLMYINAFTPLFLLQDIAGFSFTQTETSSSSKSRTETVGYGKTLQISSNHLSF